MGDILNIIDGDYELRDENFYLNRIYNTQDKNNHIKNVLYNLGVSNVSFFTLEEAVSNPEKTFVYVIYKLSKYEYSEQIRYIDNKLNIN